MHYFVPKRCVESNKIMYRDKATARQAADQSWRERGTELWVYRCECCGTWQLTQSPETATHWNNHPAGKPPNVPILPVTGRIAPLDRVYWRHE